MNGNGEASGESIRRWQHDLPEFDASRQLREISAAIEEEEIVSEIDGRGRESLSRSQVLRVLIDLNDKKLLSANQATIIAEELGVI